MVHRAWAWSSRASMPVESILITIVANIIFDVRCVHSEWKAVSTPRLKSVSLEALQICHDLAACITESA